MCGAAARAAFREGGGGAVLPGAFLGGVQLVPTWEHVGVSLRADRIDPTAARNLQTEMGVEHAGFFFELSYAEVNGLGQSRRLHVGDATWFAGVNFEF